MSSAPSREIVVWQHPHERPEFREAQERKARELEARDAATDARLAQAKDRQLHVQMMTRTREFVLSQIEKWARMAASGDFENSVGPVDANVLLKLMELAAKDYRLSTGQATENIAHAVVTSADFSKFTQEERNRWRELAIKAGAPEE